MSETGKFIKECGVFFVLTIDGDFPAGRPFGAMMEYRDDLYISTSKTKAVYHQLKEHAQMQIVAIKPETRSWVRVNGIAEESVDLDIKQRMLEECPNLTKHFKTAEAPEFVVFRIKIAASNLYLE